MEGILECCLCGVKFTLETVTSYEFFPDNHTCYDCCARMQQQRHEVSCFGKATKGKLLGYDQRDLACRELCPDRAVCKIFVGGTIMEYRELTEEARKAALKFLLKPKKRAPAKVVFRPDTNIGKLFALCCKGTTFAQFTKLCKKLDANSGWALRILRREEVNGHSWKYEETVSSRGDRSIKITYPRSS